MSFYISPHFPMLIEPCLASYGSLARFKDIKRLHPVGTSTVIGASGDMSDFQAIQSMLDEIVTDEFTHQDGHDLGPSEVHEYLSRVLYARRSKMNPLWNSILVGGFRDGKRFLGYVDLLGTTYSAPSIATGYGSYIAIPLLRAAVDGKQDALEEAEARTLLHDCMRVLVYRDAPMASRSRTRSRLRHSGVSQRASGGTVRRSSRCCF